MQNYTDIAKMIGEITAKIEYKNKSTELIEFPNAILNKGRTAMVNHLTNTSPVYVANMLFGDGGVQKGIKQTVNVDRNSLFGITRIKKPVVAQVDPLEFTQAMFTSVITFEEGNGHTLNEMALQLSNDDLFSMATFPNLSKSELMQITWVWRINFV